MEIPIKMDDLGGFPIIFGNIHIYNIIANPVPYGLLFLERKPPPLGFLWLFIWDIMNLANLDFWREVFPHWLQLRPLLMKVFGV